jgi:hypothetical protein
MSESRVTGGHEDIRYEWRLGRVVWLDEWCGWTTGVAERISERPSSVPTHDDLTMQHTFAFAHASYLKLLRNPMKLFTRSQNQNPFWPPYRDSSLVPIQPIGSWIGLGLVWLKLAADHHSHHNRGGSKLAPYTKYSPIVVTISLADVTNLPLILDLIPRFSVDSPCTRSILPRL